MQESFDPYHRWLGIRREEQPTNHYRLLGLALFEDDVEAVRDAAERQMAHVRTYQLGRHSAISQKILNELAAAKACLLDPAKKAAYDETLRCQLAAKGSALTASPLQPPTTTKKAWPWKAAAILCACAIFVGIVAAVLLKDESNRKVPSPPTASEGELSLRPQQADASGPAPGVALSTAGESPTRERKTAQPGIGSQLPPRPKDERPANTVKGSPTAPDATSAIVAKAPPQPSPASDLAKAEMTATPFASLESSLESEPSPVRQEDSPAASRPEAKQRGFIPLFNGRNLAGWRLRHPNGPLLWSAKRGELICVARKKEMDLVTDRVFQDFELRLEFILAPGANSGVFLRGRYEVQLWDEKPPKATDKSCGAIFGQIAPATQAYLGPRQWNTLNVTLVGKEVTVVMNGTRIIDARHLAHPTNGALDQLEDRPGPILLQCFSGEFAFRNIRIRLIK